MTGPEDPAAAGRGRIRAGHADREQVIEALKNAFVQGRLTRDELDARAAGQSGDRVQRVFAACGDVHRVGVGPLGPPPLTSQLSM